MSFDYEVGYKKPPTATRFKKGQSVNPSGQRKGKSIQKILEKVLYQRVEMRKGGRHKLVPAVEALFTALLKDGIQGKIKAVELILEMADRCGLMATTTDTQANVGTSPFTWTEEDETLLPYLDRLLRAMEGREPGDEQDSPRETGEVVSK